MLFKSIALAGFAATALASVALADDYYRCGDRLCYDEQADETRRLNLEQLEDPGYRDGDVPDDRYDDRGADPNGQGGPYEPLDDGEDDERYAPDGYPPDGTYDDSDDPYADEDAPDDDPNADAPEPYPYPN